jgi:hypothetical protein
MHNVAGAAAVNNVPFTTCVDGDRNRLHASATMRGTVARCVVKMHAPQAMRTMVAMACARCIKRKLKATVAAFKVRARTSAVMRACRIDGKIARPRSPKRMI